MKTIQDIQEDIVNEFSLLDGDQEMTVLYIMELGQKLPDMDEAKKSEENTVRGCQSKVWLSAHLENDKVYFEADSNTALTKGLVSLLLRIFSGQSAENILATDLNFISKIGMERFIGTQRSNGFSAMIKQIKLYALAFKTKMEVKS
ncbi:MAG: SufE family protein [Cyclobacteriaceae bacterium]|nr:SufE family protein [Cyclobacteriaceae bacterium]